ncbi:MBL fold metallo-hydrolase [Syntrophomonas curvata]
MLETKQCDSVTLLRMGRNIGKKVLYYVHCFLIGETLIDTGTIYAAGELLSALNGKTISTIINTHHHEDHTGNNLLLQNHFKAKIYAPAEALPFLLEPRRARLKLYQYLVWNYPEPSSGYALGKTLDTGRHTFDVLHTPGHSPDHICIYEPQAKMLFTGDMFCGEKVKYLRQDEDFNQILSSLHKLENLDIETVFCGVAGAVPNGGLALKRKITFMEELRSRVGVLYREGVSPANIRRNLLGREGPMYWLSSGHFSKQNLVNSILGLPH